MKKLSLLLAALPLSVLAFSFACDGGGTTDCTVDADCTGVTNSVGEDTPFCDPDVLICVPGLDECAADLDCQLINPDAPTTVEDCSVDADCANDGTEACVDANGASVCALIAAGPGDCGTDVDVEATKVEGGTATVCASADGTCEENGGCTF